MKTTKLSLLTDDQRKAAIHSIINYYVTEREEELGIIAAEDLLDMFLDTIAKDLYNKGVDDTKKFIKEQLELADTEIEISLKQN